MSSYHLPTTSTPSQSPSRPSNIRITVTPLQSAFFAGENFSCTITFTNVAPLPSASPFLRQGFPGASAGAGSGVGAGSRDGEGTDGGRLGMKFGHRSALSLFDGAGGTTGGGGGRPGPGRRQSVGGGGGDEPVPSGVGFASAHPNKPSFYLQERATRSTSGSYGHPMSAPLTGKDASPGMGKHVGSFKGSPLPPPAPSPARGGDGVGVRSFPVRRGLIGRNRQRREDEEEVEGGRGFLPSHSRSKSMAVHTSSQAERQQDSRSVRPSGQQQYGLYPSRREPSIRQNRPQPQQQQQTPSTASSSPVSPISPKFHRRGSKSMSIPGLSTNSPSPPPFGGSGAGGSPKLSPTRTRVISPLAAFNITRQPSDNVVDEYDEEPEGEIEGDEEEEDEDEEEEGRDVSPTTVPKDGGFAAGVGQNGRGGNGSRANGSSNGHHGGNGSGSFARTPSFNLLRDKMGGRLPPSIAEEGPAFNGSHNGGEDDVDDHPHPLRQSLYDSPASSSVSEFPPYQLTASTPLPDHSGFSTPSPEQHRHQISKMVMAQDEALMSTFSLESSAEDRDRGRGGPSAVSSRDSVDFYRLGRNDTMDSVVRDTVTDYANSRNHGQTGRPGLGRRKSSVSSTAGWISNGSTPLHTPSTATFERFPSLLPPSALGGWDPKHPDFIPGTETLLWSFARLEGLFEVEESLIRPNEFIAVKKVLYAPGGGSISGGGIGGGVLDVESNKGKGWVNWLLGVSDEDDASGRELSSGAAAREAGGGGSLEERRARAMLDKTIPTLSTPPSILAVNMRLEPGESRTYSFTFRIPADLPPSFRGRSMRFAYNLLIGTNRSSTPLATDNQLSRVMRIPIRVYNHVAVTGSRPFYDLTNPIIYHRDEAATSLINQEKIPASERRKSSGQAEFETYAKKLLDSVSGSRSLPPPPTNDVSPIDLQMRLLGDTGPASRPEMRRAPTSSSETPAAPAEGQNAEEEAGCRTAVEIVSRNAQRVSFDINKDGYMVASLTLVKSAYRLGETVSGMIVVNNGQGRVLRIAARLETHELIETSIATKPASQVRLATRRLHAEHHETTLDAARVGFGLAIPSGATPDFATSGVKLQWSVRLSFLVIPPSPDTPNATELPNGHAQPPLTPIQPKPPSPQRHIRSKSFSFGFGFEPSISISTGATAAGSPHLLPVTQESSSTHTSFRAVPDLGYVPVLFKKSNTSMLSQSINGETGPETTSPTASTSRRSKSLTPGAADAMRNGAKNSASMVLVPAKVETVECSIPIKVYPSSTTFRPASTTFTA